jgi:hypothetical protein
MSVPYYNRTIRKLVVGFGNLFKDITLVRYNPNLSESERFLVPIAYASKESYVMRLEEDLSLDKKVQMTLPRMSFEMMGVSYDTSRKLNTNTKNFASTPGGTIAQYNPVPYNFDFNLYLYVRNIEDGTQLIEHILPYFTPDYTIKMNMVPEMGIIKEVPIVLNSCQQDITYEGNREKDPRMIIWTLNFTVKGFIFGKTTETSVITHSITSIYNEITPDQVVEFSIDAASGTGTYQLGEDVYQGYTRSTAIATGKVIFWSNDYNKLHLTNINGDFVSSQPIYGVNTLANYKFTSYNITPQKYAQIDITPNPANANASVPYTANTIITEFN